MEIIHAIILGIVQGLTEFLPISSSGHLVLIPEIFGWEQLSPSVQKTFDVSLHAGTLIGAIAYLHKDVAKIIQHCWKWLFTRKLDHYSRLGFLLLATTIPGALVGALFEDFISENLSAPALVASALIVFGLVLYFVDRYSPIKNEKVFGVKDALLAGACQAFALQPGTSRSGITMTALRARGFSRESAARLSFLMLIPIVFGATLFTGTKTAVSGDFDSNLIWPMVAGVTTSAITGWFAVYILLKIVKTRSFAIFVVYRIVVGLLVFVWLFLN